MIVLDIQYIYLYMFIFLLGLLIILGTIDSVLIHHAFKTTVSRGASVQMVFGFEVL